MEFIRRIFSALWKTWFALIFILVFLCFYPLFVIFLQNKKNISIVMLLKRLDGGISLFLSGIFFKRHYHINIKEIPQPCVIVANHSSYLDIILSYHALPINIIFMAKAELLKVPLFNVFFKKLDIPVNRKSNTDAHKALQRAAQEIRNGNNVFIFPEGTISNEGKLKPFKNGAFKLAIDEQVPILPITYISNWKLLQNGGFFKSFGRPGIADIVIHPPIITKGMSEENLVLLREEVRNLTEKTLLEFKQHSS
jgi:1-acyl-sn-glycerol-3-phosphate acyltransferase